jgi:hypothetical protein
MNTRDEQIEFIRLNGRRIAACAWNGYQDNGRGLVGVMVDLHNELLHQVPFDFLPKIDTSKVIDPWYGTKERSEDGSGRGLLPQGRGRPDRH